MPVRDLSLLASTYGEFISSLHLRNVQLQFLLALCVAEPSVSFRIRGFHHSAKFFRFRQEEQTCCHQKVYFLYQVHVLYHPGIVLLFGASVARYIQQVVNLSIILVLPSINILALRLKVGLTSSVIETKYNAVSSGIVGHQDGQKLAFEKVMDCESDDRNDFTRSDCNVEDDLEEDFGNEEELALECKL
ncbi:hypothetical protein HPP92_008794 [Vanilla planifolia]|uniref:Uncharacterized protein n=1 Tax=Vanilla planifolia TaxID=51239 RepID=A0A835V435_VANPL|nr:hypothetical protein HPP92_008794 [Vanilla planifolia]